MPVTLKDNRRLVAVFAVVAMVASLVIVGATPAQAATTPSSPATYAACPDGAAPAAGFSDVSSTSFAKSDIDCIKYFGITQGTSATTYSPSDNVTREQMALFLTRAAGPAGITLGDGSDQGFTDISGLSAESQKAINQLAQLGITKGTSATTYSPSDNVTREQMALFIARFLDKATKGPGGTQPKDISPTTFDFTDIGGTSFEAHNAIVDLFHLGVTTGTTATTFSPSANVTREQMASFISRALNHTNARPAGAWVQTDVSSGFGALAPKLSVTHRDSSFQPVPNTLIDVFEFTAGTGLAPFNTDGTCKDIANTLGGTTACKIELIDSATNANGNIPVFTESVANGDSVTYYAWTAAAGTTYDNDVHAANNVTVASAKAATTVKVSSTVPTTASTTTIGAGTFTFVKYGSTVTLTAQLTDGTANVAQSGVAVKFVHQRLASDGTTILFTNTTTVTTDASGKATFSFSASDPSSTTNDINYDTVTVSSGSLTMTGGTQKVAFDDDTAAATTTTVKASASYVLASATGATNTVTAATYDQYGSGMVNQTVAFTSNDTSGIGTTAVNRVTNASGEAVLSWSRASAASNAETVTATGATAPTVTVYWVINPTGTDYATANNTVLVADTANDKVVFKSATGNADAGAWVVIPYDSGDQFNITGSPATYAAFDKALSATDVITVTYSSTGVSVWNIVTDN